MKFYPADWRSDQSLRVCSLAARGLWIECMCIMHEASPYGHLLLNGHPVTSEQLSALAGIPPAQITALIGELETAGVFSRTGKEVIYSRRMTRDEKRAKISAKNGKTGGNPTLCKTTPILAWDNSMDKGGDKTHSQKPEARKKEREIPRETEPPPPIPESEREDDPAALVVRKFLDLREELWPRWPNAPTNPDSLTSQARSTLAYGISATNLSATIEIGMRHAHVEGQHATTNPFKAFRFSINDAISNQRSSTFAGAKNGTNKTQPEHFEARVERVKARLGGKI